jgi:hypothetical protein
MAACQQDCGFAAVDGVRGAAGACGWALNDSSSDVDGCVGGVKGTGDEVPGGLADAVDRSGVEGMPSRPSLMMVVVATRVDW